jgi:hypothetical protein
VTTDATLARLVWQFGEPVQAVAYYVPEVRRRTDELGLKGGWMSYFGCRAAPLGSVAPAVVCAVFYNFHPRMVYRAIPDAWAFARPAQLLDARLEAIDEALLRLLGDVESAEVRRAADLARAAVEGGDYSGRPLGAANAALPAPSAAHLSLWQSLATLREYRGDGHVASLVKRWSRRARPSCCKRRQDGRIRVPSGPIEDGRRMNGQSLSTVCRPEDGSTRQGR